MAIFTLFLLFWVVIVGDMGGRSGNRGGVDYGDGSCGVMRLRWVMGGKGWTQYGMRYLT